MHDKLQWYFFGGICVLMVTLGFFVFQPFLSSFALAIFLALLFRPTYLRLLRRWPGKERLSALVVVIMVLAGAIVPLSFLASQLINEAQSVYSELRESQDNLESGVSVVEDSVKGLIPYASFNISEYFESASQWMESKVGVFVFGTIEGVFLTLLIIFLFYLFLYNGERMKKELVRLSPLPDSYDRKILDAIKQTVDSVLKGTLMIALIQGILLGIGLWIFGVPNPVLLGSFAALSALLPGIGTGLVLIPSVAYLFLTGELPMALGLTLWGVVLVGLVDNILIPIFYGKSIRIHPVFVLLSVLGGLSFFGPLGFIFGPIVLTLLVVLLDIYRLASHEVRAKQAKKPLPL